MAIRQKRKIRHAITRAGQLQDAQVDFGAVDAGPEDLARLLLVEFAITYGNDWFVMPIELPVGSLCRADSLVVTNTLGERFVIRSSAESGAQAASWRMFQLAQPSLDTSSVMNAGFFLLPPSLVRGVEPRPVEEVLFLRDEMANMAWGVERVIESEQTSNTLRYRLATEVPDYWIPLLPVQGPAGLRLRRGMVLGPDGPREPARARGRILVPDAAAGDGLSIFEEEIPRDGIRVTRSYQLTRWQDGSTYLWIGRRKVVGSGEGSSGLRIDTAAPGPAPGSPPPAACAGSARDASVSIPGLCSSRLEPRPSRSR